MIYSKFMGDVIMTDAEIREAVEKVLIEEIVPQLAGHGGGATIVKVEDAKVYVELQGGCRGCAGARMTMKNGIEAVFKERVPAVAEVIDATDHS